MRKFNNLIAVIYNSCLNPNPKKYRKSSWYNLKCKHLKRAYK